MILSEKNFGLDFIRAVAISLVLICHSVFINNELAIIFYPFGFYGVELFFVLSGFLIGQIIIKDVLLNLSFKKIINFWLRRWIRTLPLYYLILILRNIFINDGHGIKISYYFFLQNYFNTNGGGWFGESWSLVIEEWFYLIVPLVLFLIFKIKLIKNKKNIFGLLLFLIFFIFIARTIYALQLDHFNYEQLRKNVPFRLDALMMGVLLASIKIYFAKLYNILSKPFVIITSLIIFCILQFGIKNILVYDFTGMKLYSATIGFSLTSFLFVLFIPYCENNSSFNNFVKFKTINYVVRKISLYTYCIYLIHLPFFELIIKHPPFTFGWSVDVLLSLTLIFGISAIIYKYYEKPLLDLREKINL